MKKGFTLIELLAVIVILAIIALIATPIILGIIDDARRGSIEASANGYIDAVEYQVARNEIKGSGISSGVYDVKELEVDMDGEKPTSGTVTINKGNVVEAVVQINNKTVYYDGTTAKVIELYTDGILNGADPVLKGGLIPVNISSNGKITKADQTKEWYNYEDKEWANAVILFDGKTYKTGEEIPEENIKEYYVWIPRYAYRLWNVNGDNKINVEKPIEIKFGTEAKTTGRNNGDMYVHPAFINFGTQGIWVGKFEVSYNEETYTDSSLFLKVNTNVSVATDSSNLIIKPKVRSLTRKNTSEFYTLLINAHKNLNSHMITNMEWGATAYLTYSIYGRCNSNSCTEVTINNINTGYSGEIRKFDDQWDLGPTITGCAANSIVEEQLSNRDSCENNYNSEKGYLASTTGNITGIYDMSGGVWEYVMGVLIQPDGTLFSGRNSFWNSGFKGIYGCPYCDGNVSGIIENVSGVDMPNKKYYNAYKNNYELSTDDWYDYSEGMLGDATKEVSYIKSSREEGNIGLWFKDTAQFINASNPWMGRGGHKHNGTSAGIFYFSTYYGGSASATTRAVLAF